jgi:hypothetical protein
MLRTESVGLVVLIFFPVIVLTARSIAVIPTRAKTHPIIRTSIDRGHCAPRPFRGEFGTEKFKDLGRERDLLVLVGIWLATLTWAQPARRPPTLLCAASRQDALRRHNNDISPHEQPFEERMAGDEELDKRQSTVDRGQMSADGRSK